MVLNPQSMPAIELIKQPVYNTNHNLSPVHDVFRVFHLMILTELDSL